MGSCEPQRFVESERIGSLLVGRQLYQSAPGIPGQAYGMLEQGVADLLASVVAAYSDAFDLCSQHAAAGQAGDERQLQHADHLGSEDGHYDRISGLGLDIFERGHVRREVLGPITARTKLVIGQERCKGREICRPSFAEGEV